MAPHLYEFDILFIRLLSFFFRGTREYFNMFRIYFFFVKNFQGQKEMKNSNLHKHPKIWFNQRIFLYLFRPMGAHHVRGIEHQDFFLLFCRSLFSFFSNWSMDGRALK